MPQFNNNFLLNKLWSQVNIYAMEQPFDNLKLAGSPANSGATFLKNLIRLAFVTTEICVILGRHKIRA
jgi:hypothetical protein